MDSVDRSRSDAAHDPTVTRVVLSRRHLASPIKQTDVTGALPSTLAGIIGRARLGTSLTLWLDSVKALGGLARVVRVSRKECVVDVLGDGVVWEVTRDGSDDDLVLLHPAAGFARSTDWARSSSLMSPEDAARIAYGWVRQEKLTREWTVAVPGGCIAPGNTVSFR